MNARYEWILKFIIYSSQYLLAVVFFKSSFYLEIERKNSI